MGDPAERFFCADSARRRGDPITGSAPRGFVWVLIEHRGGWPVNGFDGLDLDPEIKAAVFSAAQAVRARVLLVRRHGRRRTEGPDRWAVLRHDSSVAHRQQWGTWSRDEDLTQIAAALAAPGELDHPPVVLVCAHGQHDTCCAVRGRPVAAALHERWPDLVWECTHVGGDRFAATVVIVPDGVYYGGLDAPSSVAAVEEHLAGRIHAEYLRGYTDLTPAHQVAVTAALRQFGPAGQHDYAVVGTVRDGEHWSVRLAGRPPHPASLDVELRARRVPPFQLTCRGAAPSPATVYDIVSIRTS